MESMSNSSVILLGGVIATLSVIYFLYNEIKVLCIFCWSCFLKPLYHKRKRSSVEQQQSLEIFYKSQAHIYDKSRERLLMGRVEALKLASAHLSKKKDLVWVDIGGGTGRNIEYMDSIMPINECFKAVYLVDLSPSLCEVAKKRVQQNNWKNVHVLLADACDFSIEDKEADLISFSYSLSMIPPFHAAVDHAAELLSKTGIICCVDFGIQSNDNHTGRLNTIGGTCNRHNSWILRNFWRTWFEADKVYLEPSRRHFLEYKFGTLKSINAYNRRLGKIPYYIWIGCDKKKGENLLKRLNYLATESPYLAPSNENDVYEISDSLTVSKGHEAALANMKKNLPYPSIYYQKEIWRVYYNEENPQYNQFRDQYIYAFTWEDPREDHKILRFNSNDVVLAITSAGDNILSYASLPTAPRRIHAVDLNPSQNHLLELKLASFKSLSYDQIWSMFGQGKIANFNDLLINKISPHISSHALQYWFDKGAKTFGLTGKGLYDTGSTRWALRLAKYVFMAFGITKEVHKLCECESMKEQEILWKTHIKPTLFNPFVSSLLIGNPLFLWRALGVPANQGKMIGDSVLKYVIDTLDPIIGRTLISKDNYFYYLTLKGHYSKSNCPDYLREKTYEKFSAVDPETNETPLDKVRIHTDTLQGVFARLCKGSLTIAIIMDHMDWFDPKGNDAIEEIISLRGCLAPRGRVLLRSASTEPWYIKSFEEAGFKCKSVACRRPGISIDRTNMYASTWLCTKIIDNDYSSIASERKISNFSL